MNRGWKLYFSKGVHLSFYTLKRVDFLTKIKLVLYLIGSLVARMLIFTRPIVEIADQNMGAMIAETRNINFEKMFTGVTKKKYVDLLVAYLIFDINVLFGYGLFIALPCILIMSCATEFGLIVHYILSAVGIFIIFVCYLTFYPMGYIASKTTGLDASDYLFNAKNSMKGSKRSLFAIGLVSALIESIFVGIVILIVNIPSFNDLIVKQIAFLLLIPILFFIYYAFFFKFKVASTVSNYLLFKDVINIKKAIVVKPVGGEDLKYVPLFDDDKVDYTELKSGINKEEK